MVSDHVTNWHAHLDVCLNMGTAKWCFRNDTISYMLVVSTMISYIWVNENISLT